MKNKKPQDEFGALDGSSMKKRKPQHFNVALSELDVNTQRELEKLRRAIEKKGYGGSIARAVRVALNKWAGSVGSDHTMGADS